MRESASSKQEKSKANKKGKKPRLVRNRRFEFSLSSVQRENSIEFRMYGDREKEKRACAVRHTRRVHSKREYLFAVCVCVGVASQESAKSRERTSRVFAVPSLAQPDEGEREQQNKSKASATRREPENSESRSVHSAHTPST